MTSDFPEGQDPVPIRKRRPKRGVKGAFLLILLAGLVGAGLATWFLMSRNRHAIVFPKIVLVEDFQRPLDRDLMAPFLDFEKTGVSQSLDAIVWKPFVDDLVNRTYAVNGVEMNGKQFPDHQYVRQMVEDCSRILGVKTPRIFLTNQKAVTAFTVNVADPIIVLHTSLLSRYGNSRELRFIIGHEVGHIKCRHVKYMTGTRFAVELLPDAVVAVGLLPLMKWSREAEMSADNAGLICCQDEKAAEQALVRLVADVNGKIDVDEYLNQRKATEMSQFSAVIQYFNELQEGHPVIPDRVLQLRDYSKTQSFLHLWDG